MAQSQSKKAFESNANISPDMFESPFLNALTRTHIAIPLAIFYGSALYLLFFDRSLAPVSLWGSLGYFALGAFVFTFVEYNVHRFVYHIRLTSNWSKKLAYTMHGIHHDYPKDKMRLAMPPWLSAILAYLIVSFFRSTFGAAGNPLAAGFLTGYATYLLIHYSVHIFPAPRNILGKLWKIHTLHHYKYPDQLFGVTSPFWDVVYRTYVKR